MQSTNYIYNPSTESLPPLEILIKDLPCAIKSVRAAGWATTFTIHRARLWLFSTLPTASFRKGTHQSGLSTKSVAQLKNPDSNSIPPPQAYTSPHLPSRTSSSRCQPASKYPVTPVTRYQSDHRVQETLPCLPVLGVARMHAQLSSSPGVWVFGRSSPSVQSQCIACRVPCSACSN
ncbi:hypothetical protein BDP55DRAFT_1193 [Colletotrichum godetiae]|uniref:Uncharacterized protein n=1 Tax=Colletotrichum godetiae TaxID=1209918 RepID=A0AAJ0B0F3_9PEZI|nr:uncharacterized protein BDP55DRAFT_1193 [Colletotrichum godetiae]KAK1700822.1 hypothetical protein BDP55DRAFT_1193 [Colletotrichum godetiae]